MENAFEVERGEPEHCSYMNVDMEAKEPLISGTFNNEAGTLEEGAGVDRRRKATSLALLLFLVKILFGAFVLSKIWLDTLEKGQVILPSSNSDMTTASISMGDFNLSQDFEEEKQKLEAQDATSTTARQQRRRRLLSQEVHMAPRDGDSEELSANDKQREFQYLTEEEQAEFQEILEADSSDDNGEDNHRGGQLGGVDQGDTATDGATRLSSPNTSVENSGRTQFFWIPEPCDDRRHFYWIPMEQPNRKIELSEEPSASPSMMPSRRLTAVPSSHPSFSPSMHPSAHPSATPSVKPSMPPVSFAPRPVTPFPSEQPSYSIEPTVSLSPSVSSEPSQEPTLFRNPTLRPTAPPTNFPTRRPSLAPTTFQPSPAPTTISPSAMPTAMFSESFIMTPRPTPIPTQSPTTKSPTLAPIEAPTTLAPTPMPTLPPVTLAPTDSPTPAPVTMPPTLPPTMPPVTMPPVTMPPVTPPPTDCPPPPPEPCQQQTPQPTAGPRLPCEGQLLIPPQPIPVQPVPPEAIAQEQVPLPAAGEEATIVQQPIQIVIPPQEAVMKQAPAVPEQVLPLEVVPEQIPAPETALEQVPAPEVVPEQVPAPEVVPAESAGVEETAVPPEPVGRYLQNNAESKEEGPTIELERAVKMIQKDKEQGRNLREVSKAITRKYARLERVVNVLDRSEPLSSHPQAVSPTSSPKMNIPNFFTEPPNLIRPDHPNLEENSEPSSDDLSDRSIVVENQEDEHTLDMELPHHCLQSSILVDDSFEQEGAEDLWKHGEISYSRDLTFFLGRLDGEYNPSMSRTFAIPLAPDGTRPSNATIEFVLYTIDDWSSRDAVYAVIGTTKVDLGQFQSSTETFAKTRKHSFEGITWWRSTLSQGSNLGFGGANDKKHLIELAVPSDYFSDGTLYFEISVKTSEGVETLSAGIDDIIVEAYYNCSSLGFRKLDKEDSTLESISSYWTVQPSFAPIRAATENISEDEDTYYCKALDFPCTGDGGNSMVHICQYSKTNGYRTLCIHEQDSDLLRMSIHDYCGPCAGGFRNVDY